MGNIGIGVEDKEICTKEEIFQLDLEVQRAERHIW